MEEFDEKTYLRWFSWSLTNLHDDLEACHGAAEAACLAQGAGKSVADIESIARQPASRPRHLGYRQMAVAEWAYWMHSTFNLDNDDSLSAGQEALAALESGLSFERVLALVKSRVADEPPPPPAGSPPSDQRQVPSTDRAGAERTKVAL